ncbi:hypothetical protein [Agrococcus casei]|uniref:Lipoprotein n=2 Tax=Agrococcus TaxID=46352 RepID=A0A1R4GGV6_9MICO|nr:hypothetical protein [Agrococcus casei]SJM67333.1 hypothetical protein CZ674_11860 [Agrococcus casei LMG 22410]
MLSRRAPFLTLATASTLVALTGCASGTSEPTCPLVDFDVIVAVTVETDKHVEAIGICDEIACSTDEEIPAASEVGDLYTFKQGEGSTWSFSVIRWMPEEFRLVAIVDGEKIDLGTFEADITYHPIKEGEDCGDIPEYAPITVEV